MNQRPHPAGWTASGILPGEQLEPLFRGGGLIRDGTYCALGLRFLAARRNRPKRPLGKPSCNLKTGGHYKQKPVYRPGATP